MLNHEVHSVTSGAGCRDSGGGGRERGKTENKIIQLQNEEQGRMGVAGSKSARTGYRFERSVAAI